MLKQPCFAQIISRDAKPVMGLQPRESRRQLEQQPLQLPCCQSQQQHPRQPQQQPRFPGGTCPVAQNVWPDSCIRTGRFRAPRQRSNSSCNHLFSNQKVKIRWFLFIGKACLSEISVSLLFTLFPHPLLIVVELEPCGE